MTYSISYDDGLAVVTKERGEEGLTRIETFLTEQEALKRAFRYSMMARTMRSRSATALATSYAACASN
jgi:hypothetical protein